MKTVNSILFSMILLSVIVSCKSTLKSNEELTKIAFGSCGSQEQPLPIFDVIVKHQPDLFIFLGDNIYGDSFELDTLKAKYARLAKKQSFQNLKKTTPIIATWDDHDYGWNDSGKEYPLKVQSKELFLDFFDEPQNSERRKRDGIYESYFYQKGKNSIQVILLDVRTFRDRLKKYTNEFDHDNRYSFYGKDYAPYTTSDSTLLGEAQWNWLESELKKPATIRIIGSGTQFGIEWNGYESWANFPHEQQRLLNLIQKTRVNGVFFLTGDVHYSELSKLNTPFYPIYDFTSSGLSSTWLFATPNKNRIEGPVMDNHFGLVTIDWSKKDPKITMETWDVSDNQRFEYSFRLSEIQFK